ncbi:SpoIIE family protein phosphatase [bacterium]|nr:SpoIIE family protein phosphatase [bacterium]
MNPAYITSLIYLTLGVIIILLGLIIFKENPRRRINRITGIMMLFAGIGPVFAACGMLIQISAPAAFDLTPYRKIFLVWEFFFPQMLLFSLVFPRENEWARRNRFVPVLIFLPHMLHFILLMTFTAPEHISSFINLQALEARFGLIIQPLTILLGFVLSLFEMIYRFHTDFFAIVNLIYIIVAITIMMIEFRSITNPRLKRQVSLVLWGIRASVGLYSIAFIFPHLKMLQTTALANQLLTTSALLIGAGSIAWAIIRYQFLDIRLIIRRGLIFSVLFGILIGLYLLVYSRGKALITSIFGVEIPVLEILFIILSLLFFQPIHSALEAFIEKIFLKDQMDYRNILNELSRDILTTLDPVELQRKITSTLTNTMELNNTALLLPAAGGWFETDHAGRHLHFSPDTVTRQVLAEAGGPIGFDELTVRCAHDAGITALRPLQPFLLVPLVHRERMNGILVLSEKNTGSGFSAEDMTVLSVLSSQAAIAMENAQLYQDALEKHRMEEELSFAREIQDNLLPRKHPEGDTFAVAGYNLPSKQVGGDYFDFITLDERCTGIAIGDISGKGVPAAILMSNLQAALRIAAFLSDDTSEVVTRVNSHIKHTTSAEKFATFFYGILDSVDLRLRFCNAGHNYPVIKQAGARARFIEKGGVIIGVRDDIPYEEFSIQLAPGDIMVLYTDGVTEAFGPEREQFGEERLLDVIDSGALYESPAALIDHILDSVTAFTGGNLHTDDLTLIVLTIK